MIKVTVLYNLPEGTDEEEFVRWRTQVHHKNNIAQPGVVRSDFYRVLGQPGIGDGRPRQATAPYRFITESYYNSIEEFEHSWYRPEEQARLVPAVAKLGEALFMVSEELQSHSAE